MKHYTSSDFWALYWALPVPPANHLERLKGDRENQYSIRINQQYRICFVWEEGHAYDVEITDYH